MKTSESSLEPAIWTRKIAPSAMEKILPYISQKDIISFGLGLPAQELFPVQIYTDCVKNVLSTDPLALQYSPPMDLLKEQIIELMTKRGVYCKKEQIFLTSGSQQGISLLTCLFLNPEGSIILEDLAYPGLLQAVSPYRPTLHIVSSDYDTGINVGAIEKYLSYGLRPAFIYSISDGHNPLGNNTSWDKRVELIRLAKQYNIPIIEDDPYGFLYYDKLIPPLKQIDSEHVFYIGTFSKILGPSFRVGWIIAPEQFIAKLASIKESYDINIATFSQKVISNYISMGHMDEHLSLLRHEYKLRRDTMAKAINDYFPTKTYFKLPSSGLFIWVNLPSGINTSDLFKLAIQLGVSFIPGEAFSVMGKESVNNCMRLNFSYCTPEKINSGIAKLAHVINRLNV